MGTDLDGGLIWLNFHVNKGVIVQAMAFEFDNGEDEEFVEEDWDRIKHHAMPIGQFISEKSVNIFQISELFYGISLFSTLDQANEKVNMVALVWVTSKVIHPFTIVPALKAIIKSVANLNPFITPESLQIIVQKMKENNNGQLNDIITIDGQQIHLQNEIFPSDMNLPVKFLL